MLRLKYAYKLHKPRVLTENDLSLVAYRKELKDTRRRLHIEANAYQNAIEDQYLQDHSNALQRRHFDNHCKFRGIVAQRSYDLHQHFNKLKLKDDEYEEKLNKLIHEEELTKMNRRRIIQIMKYQSNEFWYNEQNANDRLDPQVIFPQWMAATEYYHKLTSEALAYEALDFQMLDKIASNEDAVKQKNKVLMPLYNRLRNHIRKFKQNPLTELQFKHKMTLQKLQTQKLSPTLHKAKHNKIVGKYQKQRIKLQQYERSEEGKMTILKQKLKQLVQILKIWKEYSIILGLTSVQVLKLLKDKQEHSRIEDLKRKIEKSMTREASSSFVDSLQEDTESHYITLDQYLESLAEAHRKNNPDLESTEEKELAQAMINLKPQPQEGSLVTKGPVLDLSTFLNVIMEGTDGKPNINIEHRNRLDTTTSVEVFKELFKNDAELLSILDAIGEVEMSYAGLFQRIWDSVQSYQ